MRGGFTVLIELVITLWPGRNTNFGLKSDERFPFSVTVGGYKMICHLDNV